MEVQVNYLKQNMWSKKMLNRERIVSWNINSDRRVEIFDKPPHMFTANAFKDFSVLKRFPLIAASLDYFIQKKKVAIFTLQEVEDCILPEVAKYFKEQGMEIVVNKYNPSKMAFNLVFAYDPKQYRCLEARHVYLTESGKALENADKLPKEEVFKHNLGSDFEKSTQIIALENIATLERFIVSNNHFGMSNAHRLLAAEKLCTELAPIKLPLVVLGDLNQFDERIAKPELLKEQIEIFIKHGYRWDGKSLYANSPHTTFITFPYDITRFFTKVDFAQYDKLKETKDYEGIRTFFLGKITERNVPLCSTALDGVFSINTSASEAVKKPSSCKALLFFNGKRIKPVPEAAEIDKMALESFKGNQCEIPSDHTPVLLKIKM